MSGRWADGESRALAVDVGVALVAALAALDRLVVGLGVPRDVAGSPWWTVPLLVVPAIALLWRRRHPIGCVVAVLGPYAVHAAVTGRGVEGLIAVFPAVVGLYSLGAYARWPRILGGVAAAVALLAVHDVNDPAIWQQGEVSWWAYLFWELVLVAFLLLGVAVGAVRRARDGHREKALAETRRTEAVAAERAKIARELHDVVTHNVNVVVMQAMAASGVLDSEPQRARGALEAIESSGREALAEMRRMLGVLREEDDLLLSPQPGVDDIARIAAVLVENGQGATYTVDGTLPPLPDGMGTTLFRIAQEALTNVLKHARGASTHIELRRTDGCVELEVVSTAGTGEDVPSGAGHGLVGMAERAALFGGRVQTGPTGDGGFRVLARLPLEPA